MEHLLTVTMMLLITALCLFYNIWDPTVEGVGEMLNHTATSLRLELAKQPELSARRQIWMLGWVMMLILKIAIIGTPTGPRTTQSVWGFVCLTIIGLQMLELLRLISWSGYEKSQQTLGEALMVRWVPLWIRRLIYAVPTIYLFFLAINS